MIYIKQAILAFTLLNVIIVEAAKDYYEILGIDRKATQKEVKKAFRNLALKFHPDKNKEKNAEAKFRQIAKAYEVLSDENQRRQYDNIGHNSYEQNSQHSGGNDGAGGNDFNFDEFYKNFDEAFKQHHQRHNDAHAKAHEQARRQHEKIVRDQQGFHFNFDDMFEDGDDFFGINGHNHNHFEGFPSSELFNDIQIEKCKFIFDFNDNF
jgi:DnaJ-class molecular chaperone